MLQKEELSPTHSQHPGAEFGKGGVLKVLGPPARCPFTLFWGEGSPTKIDYRKQTVPLF